MLAPKDYQILFLDMNSFFASVEQQVQPILRGVPIGVAPYTGDTGCIISASKEAKTFGLGVCRIAEAKKICPQIKIIEARPALYMIYHKEIKKVIESFTPYYKTLSIDEFAIRLTPLDQNFESAVKMAKELKKQIREKVGDSLTCSIGVGPNLFLAKMASEYKKPDGLTVLDLANLKKFYLELKLKDLTGISWRLEERLNRYGIYTPIDLFNCSLSRLSEVLNHWGKLWYFRLRGLEIDNYHTSTKTIGHSHVLEPEFRTRQGAMIVLKKLLLKTGYRLRKEKYSAAGITLNISFFDRGNFHLSRKVMPFSDSKSLNSHFMALLNGCSWKNRPILISVAVFNLIKNGGEQVSIFGDIEKSKNLSRAMDKINDGYGAGAIIPASIVGGEDTAPDRISFGKPRYEIIN